MAAMLALGAGFALPAPGADAAGSTIVRDAHHSALGDGVRRTMPRIRVPEVTLVRSDGRRVALAQEIDDHSPVLVSFVYTTCSAICPVTSQTLAEVQDRLAARHKALHMVSISIDPEQDTPARLRAYALRIGAGPSWSHLTGSHEASLAVQRAFGVDRGEKMNHTAVIFLRTAAGDSWLRLDGVATPDDILRELAPLHLAAR